MDLCMECEDEELDPWQMPADPEPSPPKPAAAPKPEPPPLTPAAQQATTTIPQQQNVLPRPPPLTPSPAAQQMVNSTIFQQPTQAQPISTVSQKAVGQVSQHAMQIVTQKSAGQTAQPAVQIVTQNSSAPQTTKPILINLTPQGTAQPTYLMPATQPGGQTYYLMPLNVTGVPTLHTVSNPSPVMLQQVPSIVQPQNVTIMQPQILQVSQPAPAPVPPASTVVHVIQQSTSMTTSASTQLKSFANQANSNEASPLYKLITTSQAPSKTIQVTRPVALPVKAVTNTATATINQGPPQGTERFRPALLSPPKPVTTADVPVHPVQITRAQPKPVAATTNQAQTNPAMATSGQVQATQSIQPQRNTVQGTTAMDCSEMSDSESGSETEDGDALLDADTSDDNSDTDLEEQEDSSSASDMSDEDEDDGGGGHGIWMPVDEDNPDPDPIQFTAVPGIKHPPPENSKPIDYFNLFFTPEIISKIVTETNAYSQQWIDGHRDYLLEKHRSVVHKWIKTGKTTEEELRAFIGLIINMGLIQKSSLSSYWDTDYPSQAAPWFTQHFSMDRFQLLLKFLHFNDSENHPPPADPSNKMYKIQPIVDHFNRVFLQHYHPGKEIAIDEGMVGFEGKTPHPGQFMPQKRHARFGIMLWCVCDSQNGYTSFLEVYKPKDPAAPVDPRTHSLVMRMMTACDFLHQGHHLRVDNFFSSPDLFLDLYQHGTAATGTVKANRRGLPRQAVNQRLRNNETAEQRKGPLLCVAYQDRSKRSIFLSTAAAAGFQAVVTNRGRQVQRPKVVAQYYNKSTGGVDLGDCRLFKYLSEWGPMKWTNKVVISIFGRAVLNSYILYCQHTKKKLTREQFNVALVESLAGSYYPPSVVRRRRTRAERTNPSLRVAAARPQSDPAGFSWPINHEPKKLPVGKNRDCAAGHPTRKRTSYECPTCDVGLCIPYCFTNYHRKLSA